MIRYGDTKSIPTLKGLWKTCFSDEDAYIDSFFDALYEKEAVLLAEEDGVLLGASFFLPGNLCLQAGQGAPVHGIDIRYVYALAVFPKFRGKGVAKSLLRFAYEAYQAPLIAEPAEEGLVGGFYEPLGFSAAFYLEKKYLEMPHYGLAAAQISPQQRVYPADVQSYCRIRDAYFQKHGYVKWPQRHVSFAIQEHCVNGGEALIIEDGGHADILLYYRDGSRVVVTETTLEAQKAAAVVSGRLSGLCDSLEIIGEANQASYGLQGMAKDADRCLTGMAFGLAPVYGYLNLSLD